MNRKALLRPYLPLLAGWAGTAAGVAGLMTYALPHWLPPWDYWLRTAWSQVLALLPWGFLALIGRRMQTGKARAGSLLPWSGVVVFSYVGLSMMLLLLEVLFPRANMDPRVVLLAQGLTFSCAALALAAVYLGRQGK